MARRRKKYNLSKDTTITEWHKAVIYARVSSAQQMLVGDGLRGQQILCQERADDNNIEVVKIFTDEAKSGKFESIEEREGLIEMINYLTEVNKDYTKVHLVIIDDIDRIIRSVQGRWKIKTMIEQQGGARIYSLKQKIEDSPEGNLNQNIIMAMKEYHRQANARQVRDKQRARLLNGYRPFYSPPGYTHIQTKNEGKILIRTEDANILKEGLLLFADSILDSQTDLMEYLTNKGYVTRNGNPPNLEFIARLLEQERLLIYAGYILYQHWDINEIIKAKHKGFFGLDTVAKIQQRQKPKSYYLKSSASEIGRQLPLRGFLYDTTTGIKYTGGPSVGRNKQKIYIYYSCRIKDENGKNTTTNIQNTILHSEFIEYLKKLHIDPKALELFEQVMQTMYDKKSSIVSSVVKDLQVRVKEIDKGIQKFMGLIRETNKEKMIENYENEIIRLEDEKTSILIKLELQDNEKTVDIDALITNTKAILENPSFIRKLGDIQLQKMLLGALFKGKIYYDKKLGFTTPDIPLIYKHLSGFSNTESLDVEMAGLEPASESHSKQRLPP